MKIFKLALFITFILSYGFSSGQSNYNISITADIQNLDDSTELQLMAMGNNDMEKIKKATAVPGKQFTLNAHIDHAGFYQLFKDKNNYIILVTEPGEDISLNIDMNNFTSPKITGSSGSELFYNYLPEINKHQRKMDSLEQEYSNLKKSGKKVNKKNAQGLVNAYRSVEDKLKTSIINMLNNNRKELTGLMFVNKLSVKKNFKVLRKYAYSIHKEYPENKFVKKFYKKVKSEEATAVGVQAPEIKLPTPEGDSLALSELQGKVVLVDFWASWCSPCRKENPQMVKIYKKYKSDGFEILGVSLDKKRKNWLKAIKADNLTWKHISDLKGWKSVAADTYNISTIPYTVLVDEKGKIIAKGLRGEDLKKKLKEIFGY